MTFRSALQDLKENTLASVAGLLGKLAYLASLQRSQGRYEHWGMQSLHGEDAAVRALRTAHAEAVAQVLRTPLPDLLEDLPESSRGGGQESLEYIERMSARKDLLPSDRNDTPSAAHLNSVLVALSYLERNRARATQSVS
ncbi:MAG TPA: hypothetical protein VMX38_11860 [Verrucomicrobiae bacterium]|nr:hypothetical protein [Verrucomicrobiae bacterium]